MEKTFTDFVKVNEKLKILFEPLERPQNEDVNVLYSYFIFSFVNLQLSRALKSRV